MQRGNLEDYLNESSEDLLPSNILIQENSAVADGSGGFGYSHLTLGDDGDDKPYVVHFSDKKGNKQIVLQKYYIYVILFLLLVSVVFLTLFLVKVKSKCKESQVGLRTYCSSSGCVDAAHFMQSAIDPDAKPCDDFFQFACGGWMNNNPIPDKKNFWSIDSVLYQKNMWVLRKLLEQKMTNFKSKAKKQAVIYYKACMNNTIREMLGGMPLKSIIRELTDWKDKDFKVSMKFNITRFSQKLHSNFGFASPFLTVTVGVDDKNSSKNVIKVYQAGLGLEAGYYKRNITDKVLDMYLNYMTRIRMLLGAKDKNETKEQMLDVLMFEKNLSKIHVPRENLTQIDQYYTKITIKELMKKSPVINWLSFFQYLYKDITPITENEEIVTYTLPYLEKLPKLIKNTKMHVLNNYIIWRVTEALVPYLSDQFLDARKNLSIELLGAYDKTDRWKYCISDTDAALGFAVGAMFVRKAFPGASRTEANNMVEDIRNAFINSLPSLQWMDDKTRKAAKEKALAVVQKIGFPPEILDVKTLDAMYTGVGCKESEYFKNALKIKKFKLVKNKKRLALPPDKNYWYMTPSTINAYYDASRNAIAFPAAILQKPYFDKDFPKVVNYGGMGAVIGHELLHGFDNNGRLYDKDGNYGKPWWTDHAVKEFQNREACFKEEYSNFTIQKEHVSGGITLAENLADNGGLKAAYLAYKEWVKKNGEESLLPGVKKSNKQVFFISYAQSWCAISRLARSLLMLKEDTHSPNKDRVLGTVRNMPEFADAFNCHLGSNMNPDKKCSIW